MRTFTLTFEGHADIEAENQAEAKQKWDSLISGFLPGDLEIDSWDFEDEYDDEEDE